MVTAPDPGRRRAAGWLTTEMVVAMGILVVALIPLSGSILREQKLCRAYYERAVLMQLLDGEMETLAAGEWRALGEGAHEIAVQGDAATILPPGKFLFTRNGHQLRLEWIPQKENAAGMMREATIP